MSEEDAARTVMLAMYAGEPCRICGKMLTVSDIRGGAVFAGYAAGARSAHAVCWKSRPEKAQWAYPEDDPG